MKKGTYYTNEFTHNDFAQFYGAHTTQVVEPNDANMYLIRTWYVEKIEQDGTKY